MGRTLICAWSFVFVVWAGAARAQVVLKQTVLGPMPTDMRALSIAPDAGRVALAADAGSRQQVFIDGVPGEQYSALTPAASFGHGDVPRLLLISPDGQVVAYGAMKTPGQAVMVVNNHDGPVFDRIGGSAFSPVGHRFVYTAHRGGQSFVVLDGQVSPGYGRLPENEIWFSDDGRHLGYAAVGGDGKMHAVLDGIEGPGFQSVSNLHLSHSGHVAYVAHTSPSDNLDDHMVVDGQVGPKYAQFQKFVFSADGNHWGYIAKSNERQDRGYYPTVAVIDGQVSPSYLEVGYLMASPDGKRWAYSAAAVNGRTMSRYAMVDGNKSLDYANVDTFRFSEDGRHFVYVATQNTANGKKDIAVLDGQEQQPCQEIDRSTLQFSPDGQHLAYTYREGSFGYAVIDGKRGPPYQAIDPRSLQWNPSLGQFVYKTRGSTGAWFVGIGTQAAAPAGPSGVQGGPVDMVLTPDGKHTAAVVGKGGGEAGEAGVQVLLDGKPIGDVYSRVEQLQVSPDGQHVAFLATPTRDSGKKGTFAVHDGREGPPYFRIDKVLLSPDGRHVAYNAIEAGTKFYAVVDSLQGPAYEQMPLGLTSKYEAFQFRPDGSLVFLAVTGGKLNRMVYPAESLAAIPKAPGAAAVASAPGFAQIYAFGKVEKDGNKPAVLAAAPDGTLLGATSGGGKYQRGILFRIKPDGSDYAILHSFTGGRSDGQYPTSLFVGADGAVYGSYMMDGPGQGGIFRCSADGKDYKIVHGFSGNDGASPIAQVMDSDGTLYGIVRSPNAIFRMKPDGSNPTLIYTAKPAYRGPPPIEVGPFCDGGDGFLYGCNNNAVYKIKKDGTGCADVRKFEGQPVDINFADRAPIAGGDGMLYGYSSAGGAGNGGVVFKLAKDGSGYALIVNPEKEQLRPHAIAEGPDGKLYLFVDKGVASVNKDGSDYKVVQAMDGGSFAPVAVSHGGAIYGLLAQGGKGAGAIVRWGFGGGGSAAPAGPSVVIQNVPPTPMGMPGDAVPASGH